MLLPLLSPFPALFRNEYDRNVRCFSPEGRLYQVEYAIEAIKLGTTAVGIATAEGVVLAVEKRLSSSLIEPRSVQKILEVDSHCGAALSGLAADARMLIEHARVEAQNHRFTYDDAMGIEPLTQTVCDLALSFAESSEEAEKKTSRPFGVALLIAGVDRREGPVLYFSDPSGTYMKYKAKAIGGGAGIRLVPLPFLHCSYLLLFSFSLFSFLSPPKMELKIC